ncbi:FAD-dependent monooxygenase [Streptomyces sp. NPDC049813]|uniref:FAD-dependent monooxygenase n=1 Tax=Streptomyces sp. NPDC049813 TaxID=3365597 RepID=UPI0037895033
MRRAQVVIVGGGPVGLLLAADLAQQGVATLLVEARTDVEQRPKATTLHARTVQSLVRRGHLDQRAFEPAAQHATARAPFHFAGIPGLSITAPATEPEPILKCAQAELERVFEQRARAAGAEVLRGHRMTRLRTGPARVRVTVEGPAGPFDCEADYLVGADGARSTVRELAGIASRTYPATVSAMAGYVRLERPDALEAGWTRTPRGWIVLKPDPDGGVHLRTLNCESPHGDRRTPLTLAELRREVAWIAGRDIAMDAPRWLDRFSDFSRLARSYRSGRVFLVGDAAHVHFPIGGQGLSTGLLDALNLGWKLGLVARGGAGDDLLDTYDQERRPAARGVIDNTRAQLTLMRPGPELDPLRRLFAQLLPGSPESGLLGAMVSAQDTVLPARTGRPSPWEGRFLQNRSLITAQGATDVITLLRDGRLLLLCTRSGSRHLKRAREWDGVLRRVVHTQVPDLPSALLVRPDGYIAWGPGGGGLEAALATYFGGRPARRSPGVHAASVS